jgi:hypothetical protein
VLSSHSLTAHTQLSRLSTHAARATRATKASWHHHAQPRRWTSSSTALQRAPMPQPLAPAQARINSTHHPRTCADGSGRQPSGVWLASASGYSHTCSSAAPAVACSPPSPCMHARPRAVTQDTRGGREQVQGRAAVGRAIPVAGGGGEGVTERTALPAEPAVASPVPLLFGAGTAPIPSASTIPSTVSCPMTPAAAAAAAAGRRPAQRCCERWSHRPRTLQRSGCVPPRRLAWNPWLWTCSRRSRSSSSSRQPSAQHSLSGVLSWRR